VPDVWTSRAVQRANNQVCCKSRRDALWLMTCNRMVQFEAR
jgi:hypothetical protein